jgi:two-component system sensor histidine kinase UhpB
MKQQHPLAPPKPSEKPLPRWKAELARLLFPLVLLNTLLLSLSAPLAFFCLRLDALHREGKMISQEISAFLRQEAIHQPDLWRYNGIKLAEHIKIYSDQKQLLALHLSDNQGRSLPLHWEATSSANSSHPQRLALWVNAPLDDLAGQRLATIWIALCTRAIRRDALLLWLLFTSLGLALALLLYRWPLRTAHLAEERLQRDWEEIQATQRALQDLNDALEEKVRERTHQLTEAYKKLQEKEASLRQISQRSLALQANERRAISRDLHDSAGQILTALHLQIQILQAQAPPPLKSPLDEAHQLVNQALDEIRRAARSLSPAILDDLGLCSALRSLCEDFQEHAPFDIQIALPSALPHIESPIAHACYRIAQEALTNAARHAEASTVLFSLSNEGETLKLRIEDNGRGFSPALCTSPLHLGLQSIHERVQLLDGIFQLHTAPNEGCQLHIIFPLYKETAP